MHRIPEPGAEADHLPIEDEIDVLGKTFDQPVYLRKRCPAFEDEGLSKAGLLEEKFQRDADPEILFDDGWADAKAGGCFTEDVTPILRRQPRESIHSHVPWRFLDGGVNPAGRRLGIEQDALAEGRRELLADLRNDFAFDAAFAKCFQRLHDETTFRQFEAGFLQRGVLENDLGPAHSVGTVRPIGKIHGTRRDLRREAK